MKPSTESITGSVNALSFDKFLSISKMLQGGSRYGKYCYMKELETDESYEVFKYPVRINAYIFVLCSDGLIELSLNLFTVTLDANCMFLYNPGAILRINALQPSRLRIMAFTRQFIDELGITTGNFPLQYKIVSERQTFRLSDETFSELSRLMKSAASAINLNNLNPFYRDTVTASFRLLIYRSWYEINRQYEDSYSSGVLPGQDNSHFDRFMRLLQDNYKTHHAIKFYSEKMNLTPKYLSLTIKRVSGKLATQWIDEYVILEAKNLIKYSTMSIQEISYELNFPNQSFFGKYFKRHTGLSPRAYRLQR